MWLCANQTLFTKTGFGPRAIVCCPRVIENNGWGPSLDGVVSKELSEEVTCRGRLECWEGASQVNSQDTSIADGGDRECKGPVVERGWEMKGEEEEGGQDLSLER